MNILLTPNELLGQLKLKANSIKKRNLELIDEICREQKQRGSSDFSIATISRLLDKAKGPKESTIRNSGGSDYQALISAWAQHVGGITKKEKKIPNNAYDDLLLKIPDPAVRAVFGSILATNKKLKGQLDLIKNHSSIIIDNRGSKNIPQVILNNENSDAPLPANNFLNKYELEELIRVSNSNFFEDQGWVTETNGRIKSQSGRTIYQPEYISAIRKIIRDSHFK
jgi:hypothetical protein